MTNENCTWPEMSEDALHDEFIEHAMVAFDWPPRKCRELLLAFIMFDLAPNRDRALQELEYMDEDEAQQLINDWSRETRG